MDAERDAETGDAGPDQDVPHSPALGSLGQSLARAAQRLAARRMPALAWLAALEPVIERVTALPVPAGERFRRTPTAVGVGPLVAREAGEAPLWDDLEGEPMPAALRTQLSEVVGQGTEAVRLHTGLRAAAATAAAGAEALSVGRHVLLGRGRRFDGDDVFALLSHETEHVLRGLRPGAAWKRATQTGAVEEEQAALGRERAARGYLRGVPVAADSAIPRLVGTAPEILPAPVRSSDAVIAHVAPTATTSAAMRPMAAAVDRDTSLTTTTAAPPAADFEAIKHAVHRDIMSRIRSDLERGG